MTVVIPAYNEAGRIGSTLERIIADSAGWQPVRVIVVDNGSTDDTAAVVRACAVRHPEIELISGACGRGKGAAVRAGMLRATTPFVCFTDADLSTPVSELAPLLILLRQGYDVVMASRALPASRILVHQHPARELAGKTFNWVVRAGFRLPYRDTQCGFKGFRREAAQAIFSAARLDGFAFDVEVLLLARRFGLSVVEMPVRWENAAGSKVGLRHAADIVGELWRLRWSLGYGPSGDGPAAARGISEAAAIEAAAECRARERSASPPRAAGPPARSRAPARLSVVVLAKNEEARIARCLRGVAWADEVIVVDGESTDRTAAIAGQLGAKVIRRPFSGSFAEERNAGLDAAAGEWVLQIDADDVVTPEFRRAVEGLLRGNPAEAAFKFRRKSVLMGRFMRYGGWHHYLPNLLRKGRARYVGRVHERPEVQGRVGVLDADIEHYPCDDLAAFVTRHNRYTLLQAREMWDTEPRRSEREIRRLIVQRPFKTFWKTYVKKQGFREGLHGLVFSAFYAWIELVKWAKYWELSIESGDAAGPAAGQPHVLGVGDSSYHPVLPPIPLRLRRGAPRPASPAASPDPDA